MAREKFRNKSAKDVEADLVLSDVPTLSRGEKFKRAFRAQNGWLFVAPALILMAIFTFYPIGRAFVGAFQQDYNTLSETYNGWGFDNFSKVITGGTGGADFIQCLLNTIIFTLVSVPLSTLLALLISVALNSIKAVQKAYQTILFLPYLTNSLAMGAVFATFFSIIGTTRSTDTVGLVNTMLGWFGIEPIEWLKLTSPVWKIIPDHFSIPWAKYIVVIVYEVWSGLPFKILILFSAIQSINKQYYDAAKVDGASRSTVLWKITAPMISPQISYLLITGIMGGMKQYTAIIGIFSMVSSDGDMGYNFDMGTVVGYIYRFVDDGEFGYAFAGSILLFIIIGIMTLINNLITKKRTTFK